LTSPFGLRFFAEMKGPFNMHFWLGSRHTKFFVFAIVSILIFSSCKKEKTPSSNNQNASPQDSLQSVIIHRVFNSTVEWEQYNQFNHVDIDIDNDSVDEVAFYLRSTAGTILDVTYDDIYVETYCPESSEKIYFANYEDTQEGYDFRLTKAVPAGTLIDEDTGDDFAYDLTTLSAKINEQNGNLQFSIGEFYSAGDAYIGFKIQIEDNYHFGWIRVNLSADMKTLQIIDAAYQSQPDVPINAGAH
jgi:hypothetical protein